MRPDDLRDLPAPGEAGARARAWAAVEAEHRAAPAPARSRLVPVLAVVVALLAGAAATTGSAVADWVGDTVRSVVDPKPPPRAAALDELPGGGRVLVLAGGKVSVTGDANRSDLTSATSATWSAFGHYVAVARGGELAAFDLEGRKRWTVTAPAVVRHPRWSPDGFRVAYVAGDELRIVAGDGSGDRRVAEAKAVAPAWTDDHVLAFVRRGEVRAADTDARRLRFARPAPAGARALAFRNDELLVAGRRVIDIRDARSGERRWAFATTGVRSAAWAGDAVVVLRRGEVALYRLTDDGIRRTRLFAAPGISGVTPSPDGRWVLAEWKGTWLFLPVDGGRPRQVQNPAKRFGAEDLRVLGWCCPT